MGEVQAPQFNTLAERIAALNQQRNFAAPEPKAKRAPPPPPISRPAPDGRSQTLPIATSNGGPPEEQKPSLPARPTKPGPPQLPRRAVTSSQVDESPALGHQGRIAPPPLPSRNSSQQASPALPSRPLSTQSIQSADLRRSSTSSEISQISSFSSLSLSNNPSPHNYVSADGTSTRKLPPAFDQANLPTLPPNKRELDANKASGDASSPRVILIERPPRPGLPPRLPSRPAEQSDHSGSTATRRLPPPPASYTKSPFANGQTQTRNQEGPPPLPSSSRDTRPTPPPVPLCSRPSEAQIANANARAVANSAASCLTCRDFSGPDGVAAQYPRASLPRNDPVGFLAHALCDPFPSLTDKARAIFTWHHHNIEYDCASFFSGNIRHVTAEDVIFEGKGVCSGYAACYNTLAKRAGLECVVVNGHGKGWKHSPLKKGEGPPPQNTNHAWNAVRIDGREWKLIDACWGAGHLERTTNTFKKAFAPFEFTWSNETFGLKHWPEDPGHFFRRDGRALSWEEYYIGPVDGGEPTVYNSYDELGLSKENLGPKAAEIPVHSGQVVRFQVSRVCEHWTMEKNGSGKQPLFLLSINGRDGRKAAQMPMETDGYWWWMDVHAIDLGCPGQTVSLVALATVDGRDAAGMSAQQYLAKKGKCGMSWNGVVKWDLV